MKTEMRCNDCIKLDVECPKGYFSGIMKCDVCSYRFVLQAAKCAPIDKCPCPNCGGSTDEE